MEQLTIMERGRTRTVGDLGGLPASQAEWPEAARRAFFEVLRQLDLWCREHDRPRVTNAAIAEQAIRQVW